MDIPLLPFANYNNPLSLEEQDTVIQNATVAYEKFLDALRIDWRNDPNSQNTPQRVAKAYVKDLISGCYTEPPNITLFDNIEHYDGMVSQTNIDVYSLCAHHHLPFFGKAHVAYIPPKTQMAGLSKLNRIVEWFARRPQTQENLTMQIHKFVDSSCADNKGVAILVEARHLCCSCRGVKHNSTMRTARMSGAFLENGDNSRAEFYKFVEFAKHPL